MTELNPIVYIVLTVFNGEKYFLEQLMSIYFQEYENWFLIIIDDGSTDSSLEIAKKFVKDYELEKKVKIIQQENQGTCKATENGLIEVQRLGKEDDYVTYCDADDIWTRNKLGYLVEYMENHKDCDLGFHDVAILDKNGKITLKSFIYSVGIINPNDNTFFALSITNHILVNLIYKVSNIRYVVPIQNEGAKDYRTAMSFSLINKKINFIDECLGYYRKGHQSIQKKLHSEGNLRAFNRELSFFYKLKEKFPKNKEIEYPIKYWSDRINRIKKGYPNISLLFLCFLYPKRFILIAKNLIRHYITGKNKIK